MAQFLTWLRNQQDRNDAIGRLAMAANRDQEFPRANKLNAIVDYLKSKGANDKLLDTVENAYAEFESNPRRRSKATAAAPAAASPAPEKKPPRTTPASKITGPRKRKETSAPAAPEPPAPRAAARPKAAAAPRNAVPAPALAAPKPKRTKTETAPEPPASKRPSAEAQQPGPNPGGASAAAQPVKRNRKPVQTRNGETRVTDTRQTKTEENTPLPDRLMPLYRQLADAGEVLDAQFGRGYARKNPDRVLEFARMLLTADQNRMLHFTFTDLAEALHRVAGRLESLMRNPY